MNIQQIEYVIALSELKNFGQAADKCFITQSTLSTMIARFEDEMGIVVFDRKTKPVTITKEGEPIIHQLKIIAKEIENLKEVVSALKGEISGVLKIGVIPTVGPYLIPLFLQDFIEKFPSIHFEISEITTDKIVAYIEKRELDIGIVSIPLNYPDLLEIPLYYEPFMLFDSANKNEYHPLTIRDIDFSRLWLLEEGHCMRTQVEKICGMHEQQVLNRNLDYKSGTIDTLLKFVSRNKGITLLPLLATLDFSEEKSGMLSHFAEPVPARNIGLLIHKHFVKKNILESLQQEIQNSVVPLVSRHSSKYHFVSP
ncbi:MAG TPA: LysR substrate-binding domain-containing protein [Saprospiraceae bacterium]|nr:LysR substrate-binding domain-containing protein [Saprospiraceae bacterium]HMQ82429.1 LysR substrate-binding domain-containing protein [Saprospiraceae bacterium]